MAYTMKGSPMQRNFGIGSPLKGKGDNLKRIMTEKKDAAKKAGTYYKPGAAPNVPKAPKANTKMATDFNLENKKAQNVKLAKVNKKPTSTLSRVTKALKNTPKQLAKGAKKGVIDKVTGKTITNFPKDKSIQKIAKKGGKILKTVGKQAAKILGPVGPAITAYEVAKTIPKVTKATKKGLKKRAKSGNVNIGRKL